MAALFLLGGLAGAILPIIPGFPLLIVGLLILAEDFIWARRFTDWGASKLERYEFCRPHVEKYRRKRAAREAEAGQTGS